MKVINNVFLQVCKWLNNTAIVIGISYYDANIITYYIIFPVIYAALIDRLLGGHWVKSGYLVILLSSFILIGKCSFKAYSKKLFFASVKFLNGWRWLGLDYVLASVVFCVFIPILVLLTLVLVSVLSTVS